MILVDSNVLLDVLVQDPVWEEWSGQTLQDLGESNLLTINPIIYSEISVRFTEPSALDAALPDDVFIRSPLPYEAAFLAGRAFRAYRRRGGEKSSPLPDFFIGAHAAVMGWPLVTRNVRPYRRYFPTVRLVTPA